MAPRRSARATSRRSSSRSSASRRSAATSEFPAAPSFPPAWRGDPLRMEALTELVQAPARQAATLRDLEHRPWPLPPGSWLMAQTWEELLFAHWRMPIDRLRPHLPPELEVDMFDGEAYLGITPFRVTNVRLRGFPALPKVSEFLELNCRTYVTHGGEKPG